MFLFVYCISNIVKTLASLNEWDFISNWFHAETAIDFMINTKLSYTLKGFCAVSNKANLSYYLSYY